MLDGVRVEVQVIRRNDNNTGLISVHGVFVLHVFVFGVCPFECAHPKRLGADVAW